MNAVISLMFELSKEEYLEPTWENLSELERRSVLEDAYAYKAMHECDGHFWYLVIESGSASIRCQDCKCNFEMYSGLRDYEEYIDGEFPIWYPRLEGNGEDLELAFYEEQPEDKSGCAYFRGVGTCSYGCYQEPSCQVDEPLEGWPSERFDKK